MLNHAMTSMVDILGSGTFDRFPKLKLILVENEVSWLPFFISQLDKFRGEKYAKHQFADNLMQRLPSEYLGQNLFARSSTTPCRIAPREVGRRLLDVVERLPAPELHLAGLSRSHPARHGAPCPRHACQVRARERRAGLRPSRHPALAAAA